MRIFSIKTNIICMQISLIGIKFVVMAQISIVLFLTFQKIIQQLNIISLHRKKCLVRCNSDNYLTKTCKQFIKHTCWACYRVKQEKRDIHNIVQSSSVLRQQFLLRYAMILGKHERSNTIFIIAFYSHLTDHLRNGKSSRRKWHQNKTKDVIVF